MKALVTVAFEGDRDVFSEAAQSALEDVVASGRATRAAVDVRLPESEVEALGGQALGTPEARAVVSLWDVDATTALSVTLPDGSHLVGAYHVDEEVKKDYERTWPSGTQAPGFKMMAFLHRRPDLTHEAFSEHWRDRHGPLAVARQPGFWRYVQNHVVEALIDSSPGWDGVGEINFRNVDDALNGSYDSEEAQQLIWEDVARFLDYERCPTLVTNEWAVWP